MTRKHWLVPLALLATACVVQGAQPPVQAGSGLQDDAGTISVNPNDVPVLMNCSRNQVVAKGANGWECVTLANPLPNCADGQTLVAQNGQWTCGDRASSGIAPPAQPCAANEALTWNGTALTCTALPAAAPPPPSPACEANQYATWTGTAWTCANLPSALTLPAAACQAGQYVTWDGSALTCATLPGAVPPPSMACGMGQFATWSGTAWTCADLPPSAPVPAMSCGANQYTTWTGLAWGCADLPSVPKEQCAANQYGTWNGTSWTCTNLPAATTPPAGACGEGQYVTWTGTSLACVSLPTSAPPPSGSCGANQFATWTGSAWQCANLPPSAPVPTACSASQYVTWNGSSWSCANLPATPPPPSNGCGASQYVTWTGSAWQCADLPASAPLPTTCSSSQYLSWNGSAWSCVDASASSLPMNCQYGDSPSWDGTTWVCGSGTPSPGNCPGSVTPQIQSGPDQGMMLVPTGPFWRGCNSTIDTSCNANESPGSCIDLSAFEIDRSEVTMSAYDHCVVAGSCPAPSAPSCYYNPSGTPDLPVVCVDWTSSNAYCKWAGKRLPTEAEWEKAARGVDGRIYPWGNQAPTCLLDNGASAANGAWCNSFVINVGSAMSGDSPYGLWDMAGNAWEWVNDWYDGGYYSKAPSQDPQGPSTGTTKVFRGGSFEDGVGGLRTTMRDAFDPGSILNNVGFRCAKSVP